MAIIYPKRAIYQGEKRIPVIKTDLTGGKREIDWEIVKLFTEFPEPGAYRKGTRYFRDVPIKDLDEYYNLSYEAIYKGHNFMLDAVNYKTREVRLTTGDNYGEMFEDLKKIGIEGQNYDRGKIYFKTLLPASLEKILRKRYCYFTDHSEIQEISVDQFWADVLEARTYLESK